ncbi:hypothetical protein JTE90_024003 [Oedothorax gibbosus]|uniref:Kinesin motor domain-containing protein n=1 Tax=Oedothorax gibbosus TaxID=931172 RepID=A0AAV6TEZ9_9ARAC|nr:hypothetical protein JTE90_024003 [Oedothorax gibbosus]
MLREPQARDNIHVFCRVRPLNDAEKKAGSECIAKFSSRRGDNCLSLATCYSVSPLSTSRTLRRRALQSTLQ